MFVLVRYAKADVTNGNRKSASDRPKSHMFFFRIQYSLPFNWAVWRYSKLVGWFMWRMRILRTLGCFRGSLLWPLWEACFDPTKMPWINTTLTPRVAKKCLGRGWGRGSCTCRWWRCWGFMDCQNNMGVEPKIGGKPPKWMVKIMENPIKMGWFGGVFHPYFGMFHPYP